MSTETLTLLASVLIALAGWVLAGFAGWLTYRQQKGATFYAALKWFEGKTQLRNLGISAVEADWNDAQFRRLSIPLLINAAIYLLLESESGKSAHEIDNLRRIMRLLLEAEDEVSAPVSHKLRRVTKRPLRTRSIAKQHRFHYENLRSAIAEARKNTDPKKGLDRSCLPLEAWATQLNSLLPAPEQPVNHYCRP